MLKIAVFGPRDGYSAKNFGRIRAYLNTIPTPFAIITSKKTSGWDEMGRMYAEHYDDVELWPVKAYWGKYGNAAGPIRNRLMAEECDYGVTGVGCGDTPGTRNMLDELKRLGKEVVRI